MRWTPIVLALVFSAGCAEDVENKGTEEDPLIAGKADSFFKPTNHGDLRFNVTNSAVVSADEKFHAWTFTLSGEASVDLKTEISTNLDTVMYLYHRETPERSWGKYLQKNDDEKGKISSRIKFEGQAGEYRVVVKAFKSAMRGAFSVMGTCDGAGCNAPEISCEDTFQAIPSATGMTDTCASDIASVMFSGEKSFASGNVALTDKCDLAGTELMAVDYYQQWWDGMVGFDEQFDHGDGIEFTFNTVRRELGTVIEVNAGGDEDGITFIFDKTDSLLAMYQHNQSPTSEYYCESGNAIEEPDADCFWDTVNTLPHGNTETSEGQGVLSELRGNLLELAAKSAIEKLGFDGTQRSSYTLHTYDSSYDATASAAVLLTVGDDTATFYFGSNSGASTLRFIEAGEKTQFVCK